MTVQQLDLGQVLAIPGEHHGMLMGKEELLEARLMVPETVKTHYIAVLGHPHSLKGGSMQNKVVTTLARTFREQGIPSLRFNFRGVGASGGIYDAGIGESDDMCLLTQQLQQVVPQAKILFAGFSFGGFVAYRAAAQMDNALLLTVAPSVNHFDFEAFDTLPRPWVLLQGGEDEVISSSLVLQFAKKHSISALEFEKTGHFFHGKLAELKARVLQVLEDTLA
ncbi:MAG: hypothetical protein P1U32_09250 [Legionellaceae bacterium]|nr:hypothetical protein [Legionellaceae bacterium]